jgi:probable F420-dependent oxidoreductase
MTSRIELSVPLRSYAGEDPGGWGHLIRRAEALDAAGVDRLAVSDHVVFGEDLDAYGRPELGGQRGGRQPTGPDGHWLEPLTLLSVLAGRTTRIRLATNILIAALRRPVVLAKTAATLDVLSGGRLDLGVGVGWQRAEYQAAGLDFDKRGAALDETLEICQALWTRPRVDFDSTTLSFERIHMMPKPLQPGGVPIWVSGTVNRNVIRRLARFGTRWIPWGDAAANLDSAIPRVREALGDIGADPSALQVVGVLPAVYDAHGGLDGEATFDAVPRLQRVGVTDVRVSPRVLADPDEDGRQLASLVHAFRSAAGLPT